MPAPDRLNTDSPDAPTLYLLFAGLHGESRRGTSDLVATLASQREAREAFRQIRLQLPDRAGWAELTAVSAGGNAKPLGWFGRDRQTGNNPAAWLLAGGNVAGREEETPGRRRRWHVRRRGSPLSTPPMSARRGRGIPAESSSERTLPSGVGAGRQSGPHWWSR